MRENVYGHAKKVRLMQQALTALRKSRSSLTILDVGCGNGSAVTRHLATLGDDLQGIDLHDASVQYAEKHFGRQGLRFSNIALEHVGGRYDAVIFADILEHVPSPDVFLVTARRLLKPDGRVLVTIPNGYGPFEWESALRRLPFIGAASYLVPRAIVAVLNRFVVPGAWSRVDVDPHVPYNHDSGHIQFFQRERFLSLVEASGFTVASARNLSFLSGPYTDRLMGPATWFCRMNNWIADKLPARVASAWFFELRPASEGVAEAKTTTHSRHTVAARGSL